MTSRSDRGLSGGPIEFSLSTGVEQKSTPRHRAIGAGGEAGRADYEANVSVASVPQPAPIRELTCRLHPGAQGPVAVGPTSTREALLVTCERLQRELRASWDEGWSFERVRGHLLSLGSVRRCLALLDTDPSLRQLRAP